jgi:hypothetical protein
MQQYIGIKNVEAEPMTRGEYNEHRGWESPEGEDQDVEGYHVVYPDGYESWSPKEQFDEANTPVPADQDGPQVTQQLRRIARETLGYQS